MATVKMTKDNFESTINDNGIVIVDFWAPWCGPCKAFGPIFEKVSEAYADVVFAKCNTEEEPELAGMFGIQAIPTLVAFRDKIGIFKQSGMLPEAAMEELIEKIKELDMDDVRREMGEAHECDDPHCERCGQ